MKKRKRLGYGTIKRLLDLLCSAVLLLTLALPMLVIGLLIRLTSSGGAIFRQIRIGKNGAPFCCYKFRTMYSYTPQSCPTASLDRPDQYITPVGRWLRKSSLDELPQLWNVLQGEMSLVGPRPLIPEEGWMHEMRRRAGVYRLQPGMTGLSQIRGRDLLSDREKLHLDAAYARQICFRTDIRILLQTVGTVLQGRNIREGRATRSQS